MEIGVKNKIFTKTSTSDAHLYSNQDLRKLLVPIIVEQLLSSLMGTADTMMVSNVGSAAISAVSLVDSINILVIQALSALAAGGAILCSQYLGSSNKKAANESARQVLFVMTVLSVTLSAICLLFRGPLLHVIFGAVETDVMTNSQIYFLFTLLSFPFIGLYDAGASIMRAQNNSREPMIIPSFQFLKHRWKCYFDFCFRDGRGGCRNFNPRIPHLLRCCRDLQAAQ